MNLLAIDTSTDFCSVAASRGEALFSRHERAGRRQAETILGMVDEVLAEAGLALAQSHGIAHGGGPGPVTARRIPAGGGAGLAPPPRPRGGRGGARRRPRPERGGR